MSTHSWDQELTDLTAQLSQLEIQVNAAQRHDAIQIYQKQVQLRQMEAGLDKLQQKLSAFQKKQFVLPKELQAVIYWAGTFAEKAFRLYKRRTRLLTHELWLQLIIARLAGNANGHGSVIGHTHLLDMAVRESNLRKTEQYLSNKLLRGKLSLEQLKTRYDWTCIQKSNQEAGQSCQEQLAQDLWSVWQSPRYQAMKTLFKWITATARGTTADEQKLQRLRQDIAHRTDRVVTACRDIILKDQGVQKPGAASDSLNRLHMGLKEIDHLQTQIEHITRQVVDQVPPPPSPIIVKKK